MTEKEEEQIKKSLNKRLNQLSQATTEEGQQRNVIKNGRLLSAGYNSVGRFNRTQQNQNKPTVTKNTIDIYNG
jgi:flagellar biosynthesis/type III secretory pathway chaperone